jgi:hypothetical protein
MRVPSLEKYCRSKNATRIPRQTWIQSCEASHDPRRGLWFGRTIGLRPHQCLRVFDVGPAAIFTLSSLNTETFPAACRGVFAGNRTRPGAALLGGLYKARVGPSEATTAILGACPEEQRWRQGSVQCSRGNNACMRPLRRSAAQETPPRRRRRQWEGDAVKAGNFQCGHWIVHPTSPPLDLTAFQPGLHDCRGARCKFPGHLSPQTGQTFRCCRPHQPVVCRP